MAEEIYVIMTGDGNELWGECLNRKLVALSFDGPYFEAWRSGSFDAYVDVSRKDAGKGADEADIRSRARLWWNRADRLVKSEGDLYLHRTGSDLYWAVTTNAPPVFEPYDNRVMIAKPAEGWSRRNRKTQALSWKSLHPKVRDYLVGQQAVFRVADEDMKSYIESMIDGADLTSWHGRTDWKDRLGVEQGKSLAVTATLSEMTLTRMIITIKETVKNSNGQLVLKTLKDKKLLCSDSQMKAHLADLMIAQQGHCKLTGLEMHLDGQDGLEHDMLASVDRIDSSGHYEIGNVQLVCRFANYWKSSQENGRFNELLNRVVQHALSSSQA